MKGSLLILGAGGHAKVVAETALASGIASSLSFLDDRFFDSDFIPTLLGWPVIGNLAQSLQPDLHGKFDIAAVALGDSSTRLFWIDRLLSYGYSLPPLIHPSACVSSSASIGPGSVIFAQAVVQSNTQIGTGSILNTGCSVDHDSLLLKGVHICPGARLAGSVKVGPRSFIGIGSSIIQGISVGSDVVVGAGASVVRDVCDGLTVVGVPALPISST